MIWLVRVETSFDNYNTSEEIRSITDISARSPEDIELLRTHGAKEGYMVTSSLSEEEVVSLLKKCKLSEEKTKRFEALEKLRQEKERKKARERAEKARLKRAEKERKEFERLKKLFETSPPSAAN
jgi:carbamoylphosphate synthase small subunit